MAISTHMAKTIFKQFGIGFEPGTETIYYPTLVKFKDNFQRDIFDIYWGQRTMLMRDKNGTTWKTGLEKFNLPYRFTLLANSKYNHRINMLACGANSYVLVNEDGELFTWGDVFNKQSNTEVNGFYYYPSKFFFGNERILDISMKYNMLGIITQKSD